MLLMLRNPRLRLPRIVPRFVPLWTPPRNLLVFPVTFSAGVATVDPVLLQFPQNSNNASGTSTDVTWSQATVTGNILIACVSCSRANGAGSAPTITAPDGGWTEAVTQVANDAGGGRFRSSIYYKANASSESGAKTWSCTGYMSTASIGVVMLEYSGIVAASPLDQTASSADNSSSSTTCNSGTTGTTAQARELAVACLNGGSTLGSIGNSFTIQSQTSSGRFTAAADKLLTSTGTPSTSATYSTGGRNVGCIATFKVAN